jgi:hypothetical protein
MNSKENGCGVGWKNEVSSLKDTTALWDQHFRVQKREDKKKEIFGRRDRLEDPTEGGCGDRHPDGNPHVMGTPYKEVVALMWAQ